jgi:cyclic pyranopterin phosphate synthase
MVGRPGRAGEELARRAWAGFQAALAAGFSTKINCVPLRGVNDGQVTALARLALEYPVDVRFIEHMPIGRGDLWRGGTYLPTAELLALVARDLGPLEALPPGDPSAPARLYRARGALGAIGFISPLSGHFCDHCNRLRLTADGKLKPCLLTDREIDLRGPLRAGAGDEDLLALFLVAAGHKPVSHLEAGAEGAAPGRGREMSRIGG